MSCEDEIDSLQKSLIEKIAEHKKTKEKYLKLLVENFEKDVLIQDLKEKLKEKLKSSAFNSFSDILSDNCLIELRQFSDLEKDDVNFIYCALIDLYGGDINLIKKKTLRNNEKGGVNTAFTPKKKEIIEQLYSERMKNVNAAEERTKRLSKVIRNAIDKAKRKIV